MDHNFHAEWGNVVLCMPGDVGNWRLEIESLLADEPRRQALASQASNALRVERLTWVKREERVMLGFTDEEWFFG